MRNREVGTQLHTLSGTKVDLRWILRILNRLCNPCRVIDARNNRPFCSLHFHIRRLPHSNNLDNCRFAKTRRCLAFLASPRQCYHRPIQTDLLVESGSTVSHTEDHTLDNRPRLESEDLLGSDLVNQRECHVLGLKTSSKLVFHTGNN